MSSDNTENESPIVAELVAKGVISEIGVEDSTPNPYLVMELQRENAELRKRNAELVRDMNALDGCWEKKVERLEGRWAELRRRVKEEMGEYWRHCAAFFAIMDKLEDE